MAKMSGSHAGALVQAEKGNRAGCQLAAHFGLTLPTFAFDDSAREESSEGGGEHDARLARLASLSKMPHIEHT